MDEEQDDDNDEDNLDNALGDHPWGAQELVTETQGKEMRKINHLKSPSMVDTKRELEQARKG